MTASKQTRFGMMLLGVLVSVALLAPVLAPNPPQDQFDESAGRHLPPLTSKFAIRLDDGRGRVADAIEVLPNGVRIDRLGRSEFIPFDAMSASSRSDPRRQRFYLLGTDKLGRDVWSRVAWGSRLSLAIGFSAALIAMFLGTAIGAIAATSNKWIDGILMRTVDGILMFPRIFLLLAISAVAARNTFVIVIVLGCTSWMSVSRLARAELLAMDRRGYVEAARGTGLKPLMIFWRHMLPNAIQPVLVDTTLRIGDLILLEAALSFLGLGVPPPTPSWGAIINDGANHLVSAWWVSFFPGVAIAVTVIAFTFLGDGLRDRLDPRLYSRLKLH
ncbi:MAG: ABC transporter permease [Acidobacteriota bacterium]